MIPNLPKVVQFRAQNALQHIDTALELLPVDRAMASFRAITGEEEAASAIIKAVALRRYPGSERMIPTNHAHKAAITLCVAAVQNHLAQGFNNVRLELNYKNPRIDVSFPIITGTLTGEVVEIRMVEPLDIVSSMGEGAAAELSVIDHSLQKLAEGEQFAAAKQLVKAHANTRNKLLYASDGGVPVSKATREGLLKRKERILTLIAVAVMVLQSEKHLALVAHTMEGFFKIVERLGKAASPCVNAPT